MGCRQQDWVLAFYEQSETELFYLDRLRDRTQDVAEPLAAIMEMAYAQTPDTLEERCLEFLEAVSVTRQDTVEFVADHRILLELRRLANDDAKPLVGSASEWLPDASLIRAQVNMSSPTLSRRKRPWSIRCHC
jgi:hypothetical protein